MEQRLGVVGEELENSEQPRQQADLMGKARGLLRLETVPREPVVGLVEKIEIGEKHRSTGRQNVSITWRF